MPLVALMPEGCFGAQILPKQLVPGMLDFYNNYKKAVTGSGVAGADEALVASVMSAIADRCRRCCKGVAGTRAAKLIDSKCWHPVQSLHADAKECYLCSCCREAVAMRFDSGSLCRVALGAWRTGRDATPQVGGPICESVLVPVLPHPHPNAVRLLRVRTALRAQPHRL